MTDTAYVADLQAKSTVRPSRQAIKRAALAVMAAVAVVSAVHFGHDYWTVGRYLESTDDAYVKADSTLISPKVSGYIAKVLVSDNQTVKAGQVLARIDDRDFRIALDQAQADVVAAEAAVEQPRCPDRASAAGDCARDGRCRRGGSRFEFRQARAGPL